MKALCLALCALATMAHAEDSDWVQYGTDTQGSTFFVHVKRMKKLSANRRDIWTKQQTISPQPIYMNTPEPTYDNVVSHYIVDCAASTMLTMARYWYSATGQVIQSAEAPSPASQAIPGSVGEALVATVCK